MDLVELEARVRQLLSDGDAETAVDLTQKVRRFNALEAEDYVDKIVRAKLSEPDVFESCSDEEILHRVEYAGRHADLGMIEVALDRREALTPTLLRWLEIGSDPEWDEEDPRWYREIHAAQILAFWKEPAALPIFKAILCDPEREDFFEWFWNVVPAEYKEQALEMVLDVVADPECWETGRNTAVGMLSSIGLYVAETRERIIPALRALLPPLDETGKVVVTKEQKRIVPELWSWVVSALTDLMDVESKEWVKALYKADLIHDEYVGDLDEYLIWIESGKGPSSSDPVHYDFFEQYEEFFNEVAEGSEGWRPSAALSFTRTAAKKAARTAVPAPAPAPRPAEVKKAPAAPLLPVPPNVKPGRNDPCWCGSGKKYKQCHLKSDQGQ